MRYVAASAIRNNMAMSLGCFRYAILLLLLMLPLLLLLMIFSSPIRQLVLPRHIDAAVDFLRPPPLPQPPPPLTLPLPCRRQRP